MLSHFGIGSTVFLLGDPVKSMSFARDNPTFMDSYKKHWVEKLKEPKFLTLETRDGGAHWEHWPVRHADLIDPGAEGGAAFAASNSLAVIPPQDDPSGAREDPDASTSGWIGVGGKGGPRVIQGFQFDAGCRWAGSGSIWLCMGEADPGAARRWD